MNVAMESRDEYLFARLWGPYDVKSARRAVVNIRETAQRAQLTRILIDAREIAPPPSDLDRFLLGQMFAEVLPRPFRAAAIPRGPDVDKFAENTAVNRGAALLVTLDESAALGWLLQE